MMTCNGCGNDKAYSMRSVFRAGEVFDVCDRCGNIPVSGVPDVYLGRTGQTFENLCDDMGRPIPITSKRHKKEVMDKLGVSEAGDKVNGAPYGTKSWIEGTRDYSRKTFEKERPMIREVYKQYLDNVRRKNGR